jgi:very-short-patch-repair endonuclease
MTAKLNKKQKLYKDIPKHVTLLSRKLRNNMTESEKILWAKISKKQLNGLKFRRQFPIGRYIADFYNHERKLIIEIDGSIHNEQKDYDKNRENNLEAHGYSIIRFTNDEVINNIDLVLEKILEKTNIKE